MMGFFTPTQLANRTGQSTDVVRADIRAGRLEAIPVVGSAKSHTVRWLISDTEAENYCAQISLREAADDDED